MVKRMSNAKMDLVPTLHTPALDRDRFDWKDWVERGDRSALEAVFARHAAMALRLAAKRTGNLNDAEDAVQEAFLGAMRSARHYRSRFGTVRAWLMAAVLNACAKQHRAKTRRQRRETGESASGRTDGKELHEAVACALAKLPEHQRRPIELRYLAGLDYGEIAAVLGRGERTIRGQVDRGLDALRVLCGRMGITVAPIALLGVLDAIAAATGSADGIARCAKVAHAGPAAANGSLVTAMCGSIAVSIAVAGTLFIAMPRSDQTVQPNAEAVADPHPRPVDELPGRSGSDDGLAFFVRWQEADGRWDPGAFRERMRPPRETAEDPAKFHSALFTTALVTTAFLGAGYDQRMPSKYKQTVGRAISWMLQQQRSDGLFCESIADHAAVTHALAEAYSMSNDAQLRGPVSHATHALLTRQVHNPRTGEALAWSDDPSDDARCDAWTSSWCCDALRCAGAGGIPVGGALADGPKRWLTLAWQQRNPGWEELRPDVDESRFPTTVRFGKDGSCMIVEEAGDASASALLAAIFCHNESERRSVMELTLGNAVLADQYKLSGTAFRDYERAACGLFQLGGAHWSGLQAVRGPASLIPSQEKAEGLAGSWAPDGHRQGANVNDRLVTTAYAVLGLEVFYRYLPVARGTEPSDQEEPIAPRAAQ